MQQGSIVLVRFPFSDLTASKVRPALVISNANLAGEDVIICGISSKSSGKNEVAVNNEELLRGSLPLVSYVKVNKIATIARSLIIKEVALLNEVVTQEAILRAQNLIAIL